MERYKISAAKRYRKQLQNVGLKFEDIVGQLAGFEPRIRACYHRYLDFDGETLAWMMALDVSFLLGFLDAYDVEKGRPDLDLSKWTDSLRKSMEDDDEETTNTDVCIFTVPKILRDTDPDSYIPKQVALGSVHQWSHQVYNMQKYKLAAARMTQKRRNVRFERIVGVMKENDEARIRSCYHKFLDMDGNTLAWMMTVDMAFLLEFLQVYYMREEGGGRSMDIGSRLSRVLDVSRKKLSHMAILWDVVKLENQIPLFLIKTMMEHDHHDQISSEPATDTLRIMLMGLYHELSPFQYQYQSPCVDINDCDHLLDFLYHMTVPNAKELGISTDVHETTIDVGVTREKGEDAGENESFAKPTHVKCEEDNVLETAKLVMKLSWKIISSLPILKLFKEPIDHTLAILQGETNEKEKEGTDKSNSPLIEEITIPSITESQDLFLTPKWHYLGNSFQRENEHALPPRGE
ncbi:hypothetical protein L6452_01610 [Arctium lappa]|uniref:Uncharacterized protein n=1 Tax=Arctium lappa TaxID=4217 RepID=A0ACB9FI08_ARCLA|nr:hypothetical protein L6452_01610 [Arctium lappa]